MENENKSSIQKIDVDYHQLWQEIVNCKTFWNGSNDVVMAIVLGLAPSTWDIQSDFSFAYKQTKPSDEPGANIIPGLSYLFIALPGILLGLGFLHTSISSLCNKYCFCYCSCSCFCSCSCSSSQGKLGMFCQGLGHLLSITVVVGVVVGLVIMWINFPDVIFYLAVPTATSILFVKVMAVFLHGPEMKKLTVKITSTEGQYEAALQLLLISIIWLRKGEWDVAMVSSILMLGKGAAENLLTFGEDNKLLDQPFGKKIVLLLQYVPVMAMTGFFRIGAIAAMAAWSDNSGVFILPLVLLLPLATMILLKIFVLKDLSVLDLVKGLMGELSTITIWGSLGRERSKRIQLGMGVFYLLLYTCFLSCAIYDPSSQSIQALEVEDPNLLQNWSIGALLCGLFSFPLFIYQIYFMEKYRTVYKMNTLVLTTVH